MMTGTMDFRTFIQRTSEQGGLRTDDVIAVAMPLLQALHGIHVEGRVARLRGAEAVRVEDGRLYLDLERTTGVSAKPAALFTKPKHQGAVAVVGEVVERAENEAGRRYRNTSILAEGDVLDAPKYLPGIDAWDLERGHHDPLTDLYLCGLLLAALTFGIDLYDPEELERFVDARDNLFALDHSVHPTLVSVIQDLTQLYREDRPRSMDEVVAKLKNFRQYDPDHYVDLTRTAGFRQQDIGTRDAWILNKLKSRLFDLSRRNRLLHFRDTESFVNLTVASVPPLLDHKNIDPDALLVWNGTVRDRLIDKKRLPLSNYIDLSERPAVVPKLDKVRSEARKNVNEFGVDQLRLAIAFLHWTNFKEYGDDKMRSPLLLLPVKLEKRKGVKDQYILEATTTEAEVNPVLVHYLRELYGIQLPDTIDLEEGRVEDLVESIREQARSSGSEIRLALVDKPRIKLIHAAAQQVYARHLRRSHRNAQRIDPKRYAYSYTADNFVPLGLQLYREKVKPAASALEYIINEDIRPGMDLAKADSGRTFYNTVEEGDDNPYNWEVDLCSVTLGNFNSRRMSLVRDYDHIIADQAKDEVFDRLFSDRPRPVDPPKQEASGLKERYPVIQADPTQTRAIEQAATGESYIIQGPPGTGKSQTITNLVAYYVGAGKRVLFVCEKRAALDVVFHRLKQRDLGELCCRVHDSQADKKAFIMDLKETYADFSARPAELATVVRERDALVARMEEQRGRIVHFHERMRLVDERLGGTLHALFQRLISDKDERLHGFDALTMEAVPDHLSWQPAEPVLRAFCDALGEQGFARQAAAYPLVGAQHELLAGERPMQRITDLLERARAAWDTVQERIDNLDADGTPAQLEELIALASGARALLPWVHKGQQPVFTKGSTEAQRYDAERSTIDMQEGVLRRAAEANIHWKRKPSEADARQAQAQWQRVGKGFFRFLSGAYRRLNTLVKTDYDLSVHQVRPDPGSLFDALCKEYDEQAALRTLKEEMAERYGVADDAYARSLVDSVRAAQHEGKWRRLLALPQAEVAGWAEVAADVDRFTEAVRPLNAQFAELPTAGVEEWLQQVQRAVQSLPALLPHVLALAELPTPLRAFIGRHRLGPDALGYLCALKSLEDIYRRDRTFERIDGPAILHAVKQLDGLGAAYLDANVRYIRAQVRDRFQRNLAISTASIQGKGEAERAIKRDWTAARRVLENEFGKSMRYKSIRELIGQESSPVLMACKPVWLMSPQSVSDVLPIDASLFDVVIFDEASQITLEEGVPALFRTGQTIIVGDEMQMPPTNFFNATTGDMDEAEAEAEERIGITLDADSLLAQGVRKLPGVMLGWHYRSRHESLIGFSNAAFYQRGLLTIPDQRAAAHAPAPVRNLPDGAVDIDALSNRPISFHYLPNGVYAERSNKAEAEHIARMVQGLMGKGLSIGVVAFSMEQQARIEEALQTLAASDKIFEGQLEEEYERVEDDQFVGLFIKNLENVQGDERDVIIMSVCYGPNPNGRMLMNFGPINRRGGEKRLNVIFSRAKRHMAVVTSIRSGDIRNLHNEGANYLRQFLLYAERSSNGESAAAAQVLDSLSAQGAEQVQVPASVVGNAIAERLRAEGHTVDLQVGSSYFKCDVAVRATDGSGYSLGILVDNATHYRTGDVLELYAQRPALLRAFGWKVVQVLAKDWFHRPEEVMARIQRTLAGTLEGEEPAEISEETIASPEPTPVSESGLQPEPVEPAAALADATVERYEFTEEGSSKFWEVGVQGSSYVVRYGRIGTAGQTLTKTFADPETAQREMQKVRNKKVERGYRRVG